MLLSIFYLFLAPFGLWAQSGPQLGVRYLYNETKISPTGTLPAYTAVIPCVAVSNGQPMTGEKGEVLLGYNEIYREPEIKTPSADDEDAILKAQIKYNQARKAAAGALKAERAKFASGKNPSNMDCAGPVKNFIPLKELGAGFREVKVTPDASNNVLDKATITLLDATSLKKCQDLPGGDMAQKLLREFHNSSYCAQVELKVGKRKEQLLENWKSFIDTKVKKDPSLKEHLAHAMAIDIGTRTALYEGDNERGCSEFGICERDTVLLTLRNRANAPSCGKSNGWGCKSPGDVVGVATPESQYNIWSRFFTDTTYMTSYRQS